MSRISSGLASPPLRPVQSAKCKETIEFDLKDRSSDYALWEDAGNGDVVPSNRAGSRLRATTRHAQTATSF